MNDNQQSSNILLIDGDCMLCNGFLQFVLKNDHQEQYHFAALQSTVGQQLLLEYKLPLGSLKSIVLIENGKAYRHSTAILRTLKGLKWWGKFLYYAGSLLPRSIRDFLYEWIAEHRYEWFGRTNVCLMLTPEIKGRMLAK